MPDELNQNPLLSEDPAAWHELVRSVHEAGLLVSIRNRISSRVRTHFDPEDVLQDVLQQAWQKRKTLDWLGIGAFRSYLLKAADHRIKDLVDYLDAQKRGGDQTIVSFSALDSGSEDGDPFPGPWLTTSPSRVAILREQADAIEAALSEVDEDSREVVRRKILEGESVEEIGARIDLGPSGVRHRLRRGLGQYREALRKQLTSRTLRSLEG